MELGLLEDAPFAFSALFDRIDHPPRGRDGGTPGAAGNIALASGGGLDGKGTQTIPSGDRVVIEMPGGGGLGDPLARDPAAVAADVEAGLVSRETARDAYGVILTDDGEIDEAATVEQRAKRNR